MITQELQDYAKKFVENYKAQDNRCTAWPYAYVVQREVKRTVPHGCGDEELYRVCDDSYMTRKEIREHNEEADKEELISLKNCDHVGDEITDWEDVQWFFTQEESKAYINRDGHNLGKTRDYVKYFNRNSEAENILKIMFAIAGENYDQAKR